LLPENVDRDAISATLCHGVLKIELPKLANIPEKPARVIEVK
jgi:HSP20 family molecular chaperone IbpA